MQPVSPAKLSIRHGRLSDLDQIKTFTNNTFSWGDYIQNAWANWVRSKRGELFVATLGKQVVGTLNVRYLEHKEAWLEGVRVRHEFRQLGVASQLVQVAHQAARENGCRIVRLETGTFNIAAQRTFEKYGYRRILHYTSFQAAAQAVISDKVRLAKPRDISACWDLWQHSWLKRWSGGIVPAVYGWRWWEYTRARLLADIRAGRVWMTAHAFSVLRDVNDSMDVTVLVGRKRDALALLRNAQHIAHQHQYENAYWVAPTLARSHAWAQQSGFTIDDDSLLIYACPL